MLSFQQKKKKKALFIHVFNKTHKKVSILATGSKTKYIDCYKDKSYKNKAKEHRLVWLAG